MEMYLSTSAFAQLFNINRQTLHFYDKKGLFRPEYRDPVNNYRKYSHNQIAQFAFIMYLRTIGFSIEQIMTILQRNEIDHTMEELHRQSEMLRAQYNEIFKIDTVIQRKLKFVKEKLSTIDLDAVQVQLCKPRAYVEIGSERVLYENEIFYYFPTIVFYVAAQGTAQYEKNFGAYINADALKEEYQERIKYTKEQEYLCLYHTGPYAEIPDRLTKIYDQYVDLPLTKDFICTNIVDQFLETDTQKFITEIQIPIEK